MSEKLLKLKRFFREQGLTQEQAAEKLGVSGMAVNVLLNGKRNFGVKSAMDWSRAFGLNPHFLLTGEGEMMKEQKTTDNVVMVRHLSSDGRGGPEYNDSADEAEYELEPVAFSARVARADDFVVNIYGESMAPKYPSGSLILIRPLPYWREYVELGATYLVELNDGRRTVKIVNAGSDKDHFTLASINPACQPSEVSRDFISRMFQVVLCVRKEAM